MSGVFSSDNFNFYRIAFEKYHYTDNRKGSPMNYIAYMLKGRAEIVSKHTTIKINEGDPTLTTLTVESRFIFAMLDLSKRMGLNCEK